MGTAAEVEKGSAKEIEEAAAVTLLPRLLKQKGGNETDFIKICTKEESLDLAIEDTKCPRIIGSGEFHSMNPLYNAAEGVDVVVLGSTSLANALGLLFSCYYVFNIEYPTKSTDVFVFCEAALLGIDANARKRVAVQKFVSTLKSL